MTRILPPFFALAPELARKANIRQWVSRTAAKASPQFALAECDGLEQKTDVHPARAGNALKKMKKL
jgi:hypothetical protein